MFGAPAAAPKKKSPDLLALEISAGPSLASGDEGDPLPPVEGEEAPASPDEPVDVEARLGELEQRLAALEKKYPTQ